MLKIFVFEAIASIQNQSYENLEIIIIDDCSTDYTFNVIEEIAKSDKRIKLYKNNQNLGIAETLNLGLKYASGEFIARMDGDDISMPNRIQEMLSFIQNNTDFDLVGSHTITINEKGEELS